jgi:uncharacterized protein
MKTQRDGNKAGHLGLLILQPTPFCNINCDYCYLPNRLNASRMSVEVVGRSVDLAVSSGLVGNHLSIVWHAGEPLAVPHQYYEEAFEEVRVRSGGVKVIHSMQTNGTLINERWCEFFKKYDVRIGVSVDGPKFIHDQHRRDRLGRGTHDRVMSGIEKLKTYSIPFHCIAVVTAEALAYPNEMFDFFLDVGAMHVGFNIEEQEGSHTSSTLSAPTTAAEVLRFCECLHERYKKLDPGKMPIREFDRAYRAIAQGGYKNAEMALSNNQQAMPFGILSIDYQGNISTFSPELLGLPRNANEVFSFGNVEKQSLFDVMENDHFIRTAEEIAKGVGMCAAQCEYFLFCGGGAPANKFFENGSFACTETMFCRNTIQVPIDIVLRNLEVDLGLPVFASAKPRQHLAVAYEHPIDDKLVQISLV